MIHVPIEHTAVIPFFIAGFGAIGGGDTLPNATKEQSLTQRSDKHQM